MANRGRDMNGSQFFITTAEGLESFDGQYTLFGQIEEGLDTLGKINNAITDDNGRPLQVCLTPGVSSNFKRLLGFTTLLFLMTHFLIHLESGFQKRVLLQLLMHQKEFYLKVLI